jgi:hypothetical protein
MSIPIGIVLDRRDMLPDYYADLARIPSRSAKVTKRISWNERIKNANIKEIERMRTQNIMNANKEEEDICEKLTYYERLKRNNPLEIERIAKLNEQNRINLSIKTKKFFEAIEKFEHEFYLNPAEHKDSMDFNDKNNRNHPIRLRSAIKGSNRSSSSHTAKSVTFNLSANKFHRDIDVAIKNLSEENKSSKTKSKPVNELLSYRLPDDAFPETGDEVIYKKEISYKPNLIKRRSLTKT